jgi:hypothetical protein
MSARIERIAVLGIIQPFLQSVTIATLYLARVVSSVAVIAAGIAIVRIVSTIIVPIVAISLSLPFPGACYGAGSLRLPTAIPIAVPVIVAAVISIPIPALVTSLGLSFRSRDYSYAEEEAEHNNQSCRNFF